MKVKKKYATCVPMFFFFNMNIGILGGGVWGSALAKLLSDKKVTLFARDPKVVKSINEHKFNPKLKYVVFNKNVNEKN